MNRTDAALTLGTVPARERTGPKLRVLIAEKEALAAVRLKVLLEGLGHRVVGVAHDGKDAVEATWILEPDLTIMNIRLPPRSTCLPTTRARVACTRPSISTS